MPVVTAPEKHNDGTPCVSVANPVASERDGCYY